MFRFAQTKGRSMSRLPNVAMRFTALALAVGVPLAAPRAAMTTIALPGPNVYPESVTSTGDGTLYVGSLADGGIMKVLPGSAEPQQWIAPGTFESRSILGVLADERSGTLWACSNDMSGMGVAGPNAIKGSALKGFDLATGKGKISVPLPGAKTLCNDIVVGPDGAAYVTNSFAPQILRLKPGSTTFEVFAEDPLFEPPAKGAGLDGLAFGKDGNLYVDTFSEASLLRVAIKDGGAGKVTKLQTSQPIVLADALRATDGGAAFLMIEGRGRLDRVTISGDTAKIETLKDGLNGPTGVTPVGNLAWVSEGQLPHLFGSAKGGPKLPFDLTSVPLPTP